MDRQNSDLLMSTLEIDKDVHRTDRTVTFFAGDDLPNPDPEANTGTNENLETMKDILLTYVISYNPDLGYVQGMSDLVAPIFVVMGDEAMTFWAFTHFMDRMVSWRYMVHRTPTLLNNTTNRFLISAENKFLCGSVRNASAIDNAGELDSFHGS